MRQQVTGSKQHVLELKNIQRWYGDGPKRVHVLHGVSLNVNAGEAVAITGPSGSGKSTLLHVAGLLDKADSGVVRVDGKETTRMGDKQLSRRRNEQMGFVYQHHHLLREFTALENVMMPARIGGGRKEGEARERAMELLEAVGLKDRLQHYPGQLSGGEQQRVALARALMNRPALLLADEPTGNLDPQTGEMVAELLFHLVAEENLAMLLVTHNMDLAGRCGRQFEMREGQLESK